MQPLFCSLAVTDTLRHLYQAKLALPIVLLALFWVWESWHPFFHWRNGRWRHAGHNLAIALLNGVVLGLIFGSLTVLVADWTTRYHLGLLNRFSVSGTARFMLAIVLLDAWMYLWHRANHAVPLLWRFHRMHHSDDRMDVTTALRFHLGEHVGANVLRLGLIPLLGFQIWHLVIYDMLVFAITQFHHADISLGRLDRWLRLVLVTPNMHKVHHSRWQVETDSNFSTLFSFWDRIARTFRLRSDPRTLQFGLEEFDEPRWQTFWGMLKTPFVSRPRPADEDAETGRGGAAIEAPCHPIAYHTSFTARHSGRAARTPQ